MIKSVVLVQAHKKKAIKSIKVGTHKVNFDISIKAECTLKIIFESPITQFRNHDYNWITPSNNCIANWYAPKLLKLNNGVYVQANQALGVWETKTNQNHTLYWHFNIKNSNPIVAYTGADNQKSVFSAVGSNVSTTPIALLFSKQYGMEFSRSKLPFSSIACFTDHCDFDTRENLEAQRTFFKKHQIRVTKGFFINDFSNRPNASFKNDHEELNQWVEDKHELAYHSLSQSIKPVKESFFDFENFKPPSHTVSTWIDHGYQPYNLSLYRKYEKTDLWFASIMAKNKVDVLWNYIDSGTATKGVINQLNPHHFTVAKFYRGIKKFGLKKQLELLIKNVMFHYYNSQKLVVTYKVLAKHIKTFRAHKNFKSMAGSVFGFLKIAPFFLRLIVLWPFASKKTYPLAKYAPVIFSHRIENYQFYVFQTIEMVDFISSLSRENIDTLITEKGLFIAHTYFSVPLEYHQGRLFKKHLEIDIQVDANFAYLSDAIKKGLVWNPTLKELIEQFKKIETIIFDVDTNGNIVATNSEIIVRKVV